MVTRFLIGNDKVIIAWIDNPTGARGRKINWPFTIGRIP
jgi:hypothetical protein